MADDDSVPGGVAGFVMVTVTAALEPFPSAHQQHQSQAPLVPLLCLSPLAVHPEASGRGLARALVEEVLARAEATRDEPYVVLEGDPELYRRFGFRAAEELGLRSPSERIPPGAFMVRPNGVTPVTPTTGREGLPRNGFDTESRPLDRIMYDDVFWTVVTPGLSVDHLTFLDELERQCRAVEAATTDPATLEVPVPACPGWTVGDVLTHLAGIERLVPAWLAAGRRPRQLPPAADGEPATLSFARGWRLLHERLASEPADTAAPTWCSWDSTMGFWRRRMAHEHAIHAADVLDALAEHGAPTWSVGDDMAVDGIDEALRFYLPTRLGRAVGGTGDAVRLVAETADEETGRAWTVVLSPRTVEVHDVPGSIDAGTVDAALSLPAPELYRWVWGRHLPGSALPPADSPIADSPILALRKALGRAML